MHSNYYTRARFSTNASMDHSAVEVTGICLAPSGHALFLLSHAFHGIVWPREGSRPTRRVATRRNATRPRRFGAQSRMTIAPPPPTRSSRAARSSPGRARGGAGTRANQRAYVVRRVESWSRDWRPPIFRLTRGLCRASSFPWVRSGLSSGRPFLAVLVHPSLLALSSFLTLRARRLERDGERRIVPRGTSASTKLLASLPLPRCPSHASPVSLPLCRAA